MSTAGFRTGLCLFGIAVSIYALNVEIKAHAAKDAGEEYEASCDISHENIELPFGMGETKVSCSEVFTSEYGTGFGFIQKIFGDDHIFVQPNSIYGIIFYSIMLIGGLVAEDKLKGFFVFMSICSCIGSAYLGYVLATILKDTCIVCVTTYIINASLMINNTIAFRASGSKAKEQ